MNLQEFGSKIGMRIIEHAARGQPLSLHSTEDCASNPPLCEVLAFRFDLAVVELSQYGPTSQSVIMDLRDYIASRGIPLLGRDDLHHLRAMLRESHTAYNEQDPAESLAFCLDERYAAYQSVRTEFAGGQQSLSLLNAFAYGARPVQGNALMTIANLFAFYCVWKGTTDVDGSYLHESVLPDFSNSMYAALIVADWIDWKQSMERVNLVESGVGLTRQGMAPPPLTTLAPALLSENRADIREAARYLSGISAIVLVVALLPWPIGFYYFLRVWVIGVGATCFVVLGQDGDPWWRWLYLILAAPFALVWGMQRESWAVVDLTVAGLFAVLWLVEHFRLRVPSKARASRRRISWGTVVVSIVAICVTVATAFLSFAPSFTPQSSESAGQLTNSPTPESSADQLSVDSIGLRRDVTGVPAEEQVLSRFDFEKVVVELITRGSDAAVLCIVPDGKKNNRRECYTPPPNDFQAWYLDPKARVMRRDSTSTMLLYEVSAWGGSGGERSVSLLTVDSISQVAVTSNESTSRLKLSELLTFRVDFEQGEYKLWLDSSLSESPLVVTADFIFSPGEGHFGSHRRRVTVYSYQADSLVGSYTYAVLDQYVTAVKYPGPDVRPEPPKVLDRERSTILERLRLQR